MFEPLDFLAEVTQHIPEKGEHLIRYYGYYSNKSRGLWAQANPPLAGKPAGDIEPGPTRQQARKCWAALIKQVYEVDPLLCPQCGGTMKIISFIESHQRDVIEKILRHCGLWVERPDRAPPPAKAAPPAPAETWPGEEVQHFPPDDQNPGREVNWAEYGE